MPATKGNDLLQTTADGEVLEGLAGNDTLSSAFNDTTLIGGADDDLLTTELYYRLGQLSNVAATQLGGSGNDHLQASVGAAAATVLVDLEGGAGDDVIDARIYRSEDSANNNFTTQLYGGSGNDSIAALLQDVGGTGTNNVFGGEGNDQIFAYAATSFFGSRESVTNNINGDSGNDNIKAIAVGTSNYDDFVTNNVNGGTGNDIIEASTSTNTNSSSSTQINNVLGGSGDDVINVSAYSVYYNMGADAVNDVSGGTGDDSITVKSELNVDGGSGYVILKQGVQGDEGKDSLTSDVSTNAISASVSNEMSGGRDNDTIQSIISQSTFLIASSMLSNVFSGGQGNDTLDANIIINAGEYLDNTVITIENRLSGDSGNDIITASISGTLSPSEYSEPPSGVATNELNGGVGNDKITGIIDAAVIPKGGLAGENHLDGGAGNDTLVVIGGSYNTLNGGTGDDTLTGGTGQDIMTGGKGADRFIFLAFSTGNDTLNDKIMDFDARSGDRIDLSALGLSPEALTIVKNTGQDYTVTIDYNHDGKVDLAIDVVAAQPLLASSFIF